MRFVTDAEKLAGIKALTLMDDVFMQIFFKDNIACVQLILRIIMNKPDLIVKTVKVQHVLNGADGTHSVRLDIYAVDADGRHYDIELQNDSAGASPQRSRYNSAMLDVNILKPREDYSVLKERESVVIFITDKDVLGDNEPIYIIDRVILKSGKPFNDGSHIVYVNSSHQDLTTELGRLMHDFKCAKPDEMYYPLLADTAEKAKDKMEGGAKMNVWQEMKQEAIAEGRAEGREEGLAEGLAEGIAEGLAKGLAKGRAEGLVKGRAEGETRASENIAVNFIKAGIAALDQIAEACNLSLARVQELARMNS